VQPAQARPRADDYAIAVRSRRPAVHVGLALLLATAVAVAFTPVAAAKSKAPAFHRDETPLPSSLSHPSTAATHAATSASGTVARTLAGLAIVLAVLFGVYWLLRMYARGKGPKGDGRLEIVATAALAPNRAVHLLRVGDGLVLVGSAEGSVTRLRAYSTAESERLEETLDARPDTFVATPSNGIVDALRKRTARR